MASEIRTVGRLRRVIVEEHSVDLSKNAVWRWLRDAGLTYQKPLREYYEINEETHKKWKRCEVPKIRRCVKEHRGNPLFPGRIERFANSISGKTWSPCSTTPVARNLVFLMLGE